MERIRTFTSHDEMFDLNPLDDEVCKTLFFLKFFLPASDDSISARDGLRPLESGRI